MKRIIKTIVVFLIFLAPTSASAAIAFDTAVTLTSGSITIGSGTNRIAIGAAYSSAGDTCVPTFVGGTMTLINKIQTSPGNNEWAYLFYSLATTTGSKSFNFGGANCSGTMMSYSGVDQSSPIDSFNSLSNSSSPLTVSTTVVTANSWLVGSYAGNRGTTAGSGTTVRDTSGGAQFTQVDSNGPVAAGSQSLSVNQTSSPTINAMAVASLKPFVAPVFTTTQTTINSGASVNIIGVTFVIN